MGTRLDRVPLSKITFDLMPPLLCKGPAQISDPLDAVYQSTYRLVYGANPNHSVGHITDRLLAMARKLKLSAANYILINMVGFSLTWPEKEFRPSNLVDNRALFRAKTYAEACRKKFGTIDVEALDHLTGQNNADFLLPARMLETELRIGRWIIDWKLDNEGPPYMPLFDALETDLDVNWLAIEKRYEDRLRDYTKRPGATSNSHDIADKVRVLKRRKNECYANFSARQHIMPTAVNTVLAEYGFTSDDFERQRTPVTDPLLFWHRLALAIQHLECLKLIKSGTGHYAVG